MISPKVIRAFGARLQPQFQHLVDWLVRPIDLLLPIFVGAGCWSHVLKTENLLDLELSRKDRRAQFRLETATELSHLRLVHVAHGLYRLRCDTERVHPTVPETGTFP